MEIIKSHQETLGFSSVNVAIVGRKQWILMDSLLDLRTTEISTRHLTPNSQAKDPQGQHS